MKKICRELAAGRVLEAALICGNSSQIYLARAGILRTVKEGKHPKPSVHRAVAGTPAGGRGTWVLGPDFYHLLLGISFLIELGFILSTKVLLP